MGGNLTRPVRRLSPLVRGPSVGLLAAMGGTIPPANHPPGYFPRTYFPSAFFAPTYYPGGAVSPPTADDFFEALTTFLLSDASLSSAFGKADWFVGDEAEIDQSYPYAVGVEVSENSDYQSVDWTGYTPVSDDSQFQVSVYHSDKDLCRLLAKQVEAAIADVNLRFASGTLLYCRRSNRHTLKEKGRGINGADVYARVLVFDAIISRTL